MAKQIAIIGGAGRTGRRIARILWARTPHEVVLVGRSEAHLVEVVEELGDDGRVLIRPADARDPDALARALEGVSVAVVAAAGPEIAENAARVIVGAGGLYLDTLLSQLDKRVRLAPLVPAAEASGAVLVTDGGFHPGLVATLVRAAAEGLDGPLEARVACGIRIDWKREPVAEETAREFTREVVAGMGDILEDRTWRPATFADAAELDLGQPLGRRVCYPMELEELHLLAQRDLRFAGLRFSVAGFSPLVDNVLLPLLYGAFRIAPAATERLGSRLLAQALRQTSSPPFGTVLLAEVEGWLGVEPVRRRIRLAHPDGYEMTALPAALLVERWLEGSLPLAPGLHHQALVLPPRATLGALAERGCELAESVGRPEAKPQPSAPGAKSHERDQGDLRRA